MIHQTKYDPNLECQAGADERTRLVRWCVRLTGDGVLAEDVAQETLLIAWAQEQKLRNPERRFQWLMGIARNLCLNLNRRRALDRVRLTGLDLDQISFGATGEHPSTNHIDLDLEWERHEVAELLDRALTLLPARTRGVLIHRYVNESPYADIAEQLGLSEGAVKVRLHRGRLAMRRLLATELRQDAIANGLHISDIDEFRETHIWCPFCGRRRLEGMLDGARGQLNLRCPGCGDRPAGFNSNNDGMKLLIGLKSYKAARSRLLADNYLQSALTKRAAPCLNCGRVNPVSMGSPDSIEPSLRVPYALHIVCQGCGSTVDSVLQGIALGLPQARRFWRNNPRMRALPLREIEAAGGPAVVTSFESVTGTARLDVISSRNTFETITVHGDLDE